MRGENIMSQSLFMTYCCKDKAKIPSDTMVTPSELYLSSRIQSFITVCNTKKLEWVIFSDFYGIVESHKKIHSYDKAPYEVTETDYHRLLEITIQKILSYNTVYFYYNADSYKCRRDFFSLPGTYGSFVYLYHSRHFA